MSILYEKDEATRRVTLTVQGGLTADDLIAAANRQAADQAWSYRLLLDARERAGEAVTAIMVRAFVDHNAQMSSQHGPPGPFAIVVRDDAGFGMGRMFETLSGTRSARRIKIFRAIDDASAWLEECV
jgi:hypothetical protein